MTKAKSKKDQREADLAAARKAGGNDEQSHWMARLRAVMKRRPKPEKKAAAR